MKRKGLLRVLGSVSFAVVLIVLVILGARLNLALAQQDEGRYPSKRIICIVPFAPGGNMDGNARMMSKLMPDYLPNRVNVIVKNVVGAEAQKGTLEIYRAKPDGYTISVFQLPAQILDAVIHLEKRVGEGIMNVTWLGVMTTYVNVGYVKADAPFKTIGDLQSADRIKIGSSGGSGLYNAKLIPHVLGLKGHLVAGYRSSRDVVVGLVRGDVDLINQSVATGLKYVENGDIRPLYIIGPARVKQFPDTPTLGELGYPELRNCYAGRFIVGPPGMDPKHADILSAAIMKSVDSPSFLEYCKKGALDVVTPAKTRQETEAMAKDIYTVWGKYMNLFRK